MNTGVMQSDVKFPIRFDADVVAREAGFSLSDLRKKGDRGHAVTVMGKGAAKIVAALMKENKIKGAIAMGGGGGTYIAITAMQEIALGIPKICLSTMTGKDLSGLIGSRDIILFPSIVDMAGLNSISRLLIKQAAASICSISNVSAEEASKTKGRIAISMFGNTSACVNLCTELLKSKGYEVFPFHANGIGGRTMEALISERYFNAVLDITTTELADDLCGGICSAGPSRMDAAANLGIPQVVVPGCLDMVNFGRVETVPSHYKNRELYSWSPEVTLMRTNEEENKILGERLVQKVRKSLTPVVILIPVKGVSQIDIEGGVFHRPEVDKVLFETIKANSIGKIPVVEVDAHINDAMFATRLVSTLLEIIEKN
ncbi:hypothetical protein SAE01_01480 [Segetibacter aerophilus]|uniref:Uncharacterized protein n=2 Tax=Segetibacter aerophilus TaxID=670293 RepID=A0A512B6R6_9BACT|nr:hypothetical protein SAE01_01480 [Segetibacter aerophilus]